MEYEFISFLTELPGYKLETSVNGTHTTFTSKSATAKFPINLFVKVLICGDLVTTMNTATFPTTPIILIILYAMLKINKNEAKKKQTHNLMDLNQLNIL